MIATAHLPAVLFKAGFSANQHHTQKRHFLPKRLENRAKGCRMLVVRMTDSRQ
jgi:hypothetical protein